MNGGEEIEERMGGGVNRGKLERRRDEWRGVLEARG
jgi:hypothetical protein